MPQYKIVIGFGVTPDGSTETYITKQITSPTDARATIQGLLDARFAFLPDQISVAGVRISDASVKRASRLLLPGQPLWPDKIGGLNIPSKGAYVTGTDRTDAAPYANALQLQVNYGGIGRSTPKYLVGVPKGAERIEPGNLFRGNLNSWFTLVDAFCTLLQTGQWYLRARKQDGDFAPVQVQQVVGAFLGIGDIALVVAANTPPNLKVGEQIQISGFRNRKNVTGSINGFWTVASINNAPPDPTTRQITLKDSTAVGATQFKKLGTIQRIDWELQLIGIVHTQRIAKHNRGGPFTKPRGKRRTRVFLGS